MRKESTCLIQLKARRLMLLACLVTMFSIFKVLLIMNEGKMLPEGMFTSRELSTFLGRKVITSLLDTNENVIKTNKLVLSLNKLNNADNLEDGKPSNVLLRHHMTSSEELKNFEPVSPQYKKLKNG